MPWLMFATHTNGVNIPVTPISLSVGIWENAKWVANGSLLQVLHWGTMCWNSRLILPKPVMLKKRRVEHDVQSDSFLQ